RRTGARPGAMGRAGAGACEGERAGTGAGAGKAAERSRSPLRGCFEIVQPCDGASRGLISTLGSVREALSRPLFACRPRVKTSPRPLRIRATAVDGRRRLFGEGPLSEIVPARPYRGRKRSRHSHTMANSRPLLGERGPREGDWTKAELSKGPSEA